MNAARLYTVYILECADGTLYTGITQDLRKRLCEHNGEVGGGAKYTRGRRPVSVVYTEAVSDRGTALRREYAVKRLSRKQKMALIGTPERNNTPTRTKKKKMQ